MLSWIDEAAVAMANRVCETPNMVTRKMTEVLFENPVKVGHSINIYGEVGGIGNTSITLNMEARRYNVYTGEEVKVVSITIVFVRIDDNGQTVPLGENVKKRYST